MNEFTLEQRRGKVNQLLSSSIDRKLSKGGSSKALEWSEEAHHLANMPPRLPAPWPQLTAYRLAHLRCRAGQLSVADLQEIDALFVEASTIPELRSLACAYRIAILTRLECTDSRSSRSQWQQKRSVCFEEAVQAIRHVQINPRTTSRESMVLQASAFNLLEFSSYLLGLPYDSLEGLAIQDVVEQCYSGGWFIAGRGIERIRMTEEFARCEFYARTTAKNGLFVELHRQSASWKSVGDGVDSESELVNVEFAKLVLLSIEQPKLSQSDLRRRTVGTAGEDSDARFRQVKARTQKAIRNLFKDDSLKVFDGNVFNQNICVIGLVEGAAFR
jgi:hypothetical protein